jgi:hypothetical protein
MSDENQPCLNFGKYSDQPITEVPTHYLKWVRRTFERSVPVVDDELVRRGEYEVQPLRPLPTYDAKNATRIFAEARQKASKQKRAARKSKRRKKKKQRLQEARAKWRQEQIAIVERVKAGFVVVGRDEAQDCLAYRIRLIRRLKNPCPALEGPIQFVICRD